MKKTKLTARGQIPVLGGCTLTLFMLLKLREPAFCGLHLCGQKRREGRGGSSGHPFHCPWAGAQSSARGNLESLVGEIQAWFLH